MDTIRTNVSKISGFPEFLPNVQIAMVKAMDLIRDTYESFGFLPIETPAVERAETLLSKGVSDKEVYGLRRMSAQEGENPDKDLALRFDLTVPLARYVAEHEHDLTFPFRRYQIQPVWRGERAQKGRFRQFYQCDIDVIGKDTLSLHNDAEIPVIIFQIFRRMGIGPFTIGVSNRKVLEGLLRHAGLDDGSIGPAYAALDDLHKKGAEVTRGRLRECGIADAAVDALMTYVSKEFNQGDVVERLKQMKVNALFEEGVRELEFVMRTAPLHLPITRENLATPTALETRNAFAQSFKIDLSVIRGLDYYTGTIYETTLDNYPGVGSICSGGRYANLASLFTKTKLPGVGISIGLTRLAAQLIEAGVLKAETSTVAQVLVTVQVPEQYENYVAVANRLRVGDGNGPIPAEVYNEDANLKKQLTYAERKGFPVVIVANSEELSRDRVRVKNMKFRQEQEVTIPQLVSFVRQLLPELP
jgi:histidyl-tRNA synthetase